ncbi:hypothetical protein TBLA_0C00900 [Henningerozyma blattae CBS 6284]|uniref:Flavoprotein domain-containing protein n=1 Tax=Henningerozyma blattae (strain ATCC 34711 / CBS 6284 / DSM 70876 / NBRC 10599 / NRRL Y-10934 / UCD 77-7) TaxID=1071380 RepID=I2H0K2_HENB6|nr:hypothetical protein TBLA_0C00900 [Tetrapisispora blattae CBS 6284]CCH59904.1 hypothetical protein TBLA_0C00900 [Tetrapisispora blattae CBS 6284]
MISSEQSKETSRPRQGSAPTIQFNHQSQSNTSAANIIPQPVSILTSRNSSLTSTNKSNNGGNSGIGPTSPNGSTTNTTPKTNKMSSSSITDLHNYKMNCTSPNVTLLNTSSNANNKSSSTTNLMNINIVNPASNLAGNPSTNPSSWVPYECKNNGGTVVSFTSDDPKKKQPHHRYSISSKPSKNTTNSSSNATSPNNSFTDLSNLPSNNNVNISPNTNLSLNSISISSTTPEIYPHIIDKVLNSTSSATATTSNLSDDFELNSCSKDLSNNKLDMNTVFKDNTSINDKGNNDEDEVDKNSIVHMPGDFVYFDMKKSTLEETTQTNKNKVCTTSVVIPSTTAATTTTTVTTAKQLHGTNMNSNKRKVIQPPESQIPFMEYFTKEDDRKIHILIAASGSVATIKVPMIIDKLFKIYTPEKVSIQLIVTKPAEHFLRGLKLSTHVKIWREEDEWSHSKKITDPILHHELRKWADIFVIAPLSANTLAKMANGICNNLLTSVFIGWPTSVPILAAPAMNTFMYCNPMTKKHLRILEEDYTFITILRPVEKVLVCGDIGMGGMREWNEIVEIIRGKILEIKKLRESEGDENIIDIPEDNEDDTADVECDDENEDDDSDVVDEPDSEDDDDESDDDDDESDIETHSLNVVNIGND